MESKVIYSWLKAHPLININGLCKEVGIDRANFIKWMAAGKELKDDVLKKLETILLNYGLIITINHTPPFATPELIKATKEAHARNLKTFEKPEYKNATPVRSNFLQERMNKKLGIK